MNDLPKPRACKTAAEIQVGDRIEVDYRITDDDALNFATLSGDYNPVHFDEVYAAKSAFGKRIAHGVLSLSKFSGIFGMDLPGIGTLWEDLDVRFIAPVYLNTQYKAVAEVVTVTGKRVEFSIWVEDADGEKVLDGSARVIAIMEFQRRRLQKLLET